MLRRQQLRVVAAASSSSSSSLAIITTTAFRCNSSANKGGAVGSINDMNPSYINEIPLTENLTKEAAKFTHKRSDFQYEGSAKATEVGARNEAAFIDYEGYKPDAATEPSAAFAMPSVINLLTIAPISIAATFLAAAFWGVAFWRWYAYRNFRSVIIERPAAL